MKDRFRISVIFATLLVLLTFTGCGKTKEATSNDTDEKVTTEKEKGSEEDSNISSPSEAVETILPEEIAVSDVNVKLKVNETKKINVIVLPDKADNKNVIWTSSDDSIVTVEAGLLTGKSVGECKIAVSSESAPAVSTTIIVEVIASAEGNNNAASTTDADEVGSETDADEVEEAAESTMHANGAGQNDSADDDNNEANTGNDNTADNNSAGNDNANSDSNGNNASGNNNVTTEATTEATTETTAQENASNNNSGNAAGFNYAYCEEVLKLVNQVRAEVGVAPLVMDYSMQKASDVRGKELATLFDHTRPNGSMCFTALDEAGISYMAAGENIAWGQRTPEEVMDSWINSEGHYQNIINPSYGRIAISCYYDPDSEMAAWKGCYWVQMFAD